MYRNWYESLSRQQIRGIRVRTRTMLHNGWRDIPAGTECVVTRKYRGLSLVTQEAESVHIAEVDPANVEVIDISAADICLDEAWYHRVKREDIVGIRVRTIEELTFGSAVVAAGTLCRIRDKRLGLSLQTDPCSHCGISVLLKRVRPSSVQIVLSSNRRLLADGHA